MTHLITHEVKTSVCGSTEHMFHRNVFSPKGGSLSMLQVTRGGIGRSAEFPKDRGNQNQVLESAKMKNTSWKRKNKRKKCVFLI